MPTQFTINKNAPFPQQGVDVLWGTTLNFMINTYDITFGSTYFQTLSNVSPIVFLTSSIAGSYVPIQFQVIQFNGVITQDIIVQFPPGVGGAWFIENFTTGAFNVTLQVGSGPSGTTFKPPQGFRSAIRSDGTNIDQATNVPFWLVAPTIPNNTVIANTSGIVAKPLPVDPSTLKFTFGLNMNGGTFTSMGGIINMGGGTINTNAGTIDMGTGTIINLATPVNPNDGVNKAYVDNKVSLIQSIPASVGLTIKNNVGTPNTKVDVTVDSIQVTNSSSAWIVRTAISLTIDATVVGANGIDVGALAPSTFYHVYVIDNGTTTAGLLSLSATSPTLPFGYTYINRVGARPTNGSSNFIVVNQIRGIAEYTSFPIMGTTTSTISVSSFIPSTAHILRANITAGPSADTRATLGAVSGNPTMQTASIGSAGGIWCIYGEIVLNSTSVFMTQVGGAAETRCVGWIDSILA